MPSEKDQERAPLRTNSATSYEYALIIQHKHDEISVKDDSEALKQSVCTAKVQDGDEEEGSALKRWQQWVPMDKRLYEAVQLIQVCMLQKVHELFETANIPYWICGGTLLGAIRHGGLIPHDDDVDIECFESDLEAIAAIPTEPPFYTGFHISTATWEGHAVAKLNFFRGEFSVDVFPRPEDLAQDQHFCSRDEVFPLKLYPFHNIQLWGPGEPEAYLNRCYGDWREFVMVWNHDYNWFHLPGFSPTKTILSLQEYDKVVTKAGVVPPIVEVCADDTYTAFYESYGDDFYERYSKYRFQRMVRRNRAAAKWREEQYEKGTWLGLFTSVQLSSCATLGLAPPRRHYRLPKGASNLHKRARKRHTKVRDANNIRYLCTHSFFPLPLRYTVSLQSSKRELSVAFQPEMFLLETPQS